MHIKPHPDIKLRTAVLFSGGYDSGAAVFKSIRDNTFDLLFIDYNQSYLENELKAAQEFAYHWRLKLVVRKMLGMTDMKDRNLHFLSVAKQLGYERVIVGIRNPTPLFDKHGDSNYFTVSRYAKKIGIKVSFPVLCWTKFMIFHMLHEYRYVKFYNCYNNQRNCWVCDCSNCIQQRKYQYILNTTRKVSL